MLTYTFSKREKFLLALLGIIAVVVVWYQLVFVNVQNQMSELDSKIAEVQDQAILNQAKAVQYKKMSSEVEAYKAQGIAPIVVPTYDNTQNLMAYLNGVIPTDREYSIDFEEPEVAEDGTVHRVGQITYETSSYEEARAVAQKIARGPYPCTVDSLGIVKKNQGGSNNGAGTTFTTTGKLTFIEKASANAKTKTEQGNKGTSQGQDLSKLINR